MKFLKELGQPLIYAGLALFTVAGRADGLWLYWTAAALFVAGAILFVASPFLPGGKAGKGPFSGGIFTRGNVWGAAPRPPAPSSYAPVRTAPLMPEWVYAVSAAISIVGTIAYFLGPNGVSPRTVGTFALIPGGFFFFLGAKSYYGGVVGRRNVVRGAATVLGFLGAIAGIYTWVLVFAGAFDGPERGFWMAAGTAALLAGLAVAAYGVKYHQSYEGVSIGRELGFADAASGLFAPDGFYDSKGVLNGIEVKFNVEQRDAVTHKGRYTPPRFFLEVLCACANPRGLRLEVRPSGFFSFFSLSGLPKSPHVDYWDYYDIRANLPDVAAGPLAAAKAVENVFGEQTGFSRLSLRGSALKANFSIEGCAGTDYVRRVLEGVTRLAKAFG